MLEADFRPASGSELGGGGKCRWSRTGAAEPSPRRGDAENGRARRAWVETDGAPPVRLGGQLTAKKGEGLRISATEGRPAAGMGARPGAPALGGTGAGLAARPRS
jgi:hypothetical protein